MQLWGGRDGPVSNDRVLCISDLHAPYQHRDTCAFLLGVARKYMPTRVVSLGDEVDKHAMGFHESDPDLPSAGDELQEAISELFPLYQIFPRVDVVDSNHGSMHLRKAKHGGIPSKYLRDYGEILEAPAGWSWHNALTIELPGGQDLYFTHGLKKNGLALATALGCCVVQGHYHSEFNIGYASTPSQLLWSMQVGCSVDDRSLAFHYNKNTAIRPVLGHGIVINGQPKLLPMILKKGREWTGIIP